MKLLLLAVGACISAHVAAQEVSLTASRTGANEWQYMLTNLDGPPGVYPVYFSIPVQSALAIQDAGLAAPPGWGVYGTTNNLGYAESLSFAVGESATESQLPHLGATLSGFRLSVGVPTVLSTQPILFGFGLWASTSLVNEGELIGPVPVVGETQISAQIGLEGFEGRRDLFRYGTLIFSKSGSVLVKSAGIDQNGQLLCAGPSEPGTYTVSFEFYGYLRRVVQISVSGGSGAISVFLKAGDVDGDNEIGPADFSLLAAAFGSVRGEPPYSEDADLNGDEEVGPADFGILAANFGEAGE